MASNQQIWGLGWALAGSSVCAFSPHLALDPQMVTEPEATRQQQSLRVVSSGARASRVTHLYKKDAVHKTIHHPLCPDGVWASRTCVLITATFLQIHINEYFLKHRKADRLSQQMPVCHHPGSTTNAFMYFPRAHGVCCRCHKPVSLPVTSGCLFP